MMNKNTKYRILLKQYKHQVYNYTMYMLKNKMDADDAAQEVLIKIWCNLDNFNFLKAKAWIMRTTHNMCLDYLRKRKRELNYFSFIEEDEVENYTNNSGNPLKIFHLNSTKREIENAIAKLPDNLRSVFVLYEIEGMKYKEISKILEIPLNSVKVYMLRARKKLQEELKKNELQEAI